MTGVVRVSSRKLYQGGNSVLIMKGEHDQMKNGCDVYSELGYCEGVVETFGKGGVGELGGEAPPLVDETLVVLHTIIVSHNCACARSAITCLKLVPRDNYY